MAYLVDVLVGTRGTEAVQTELLVSIALPAHGGGGLNRQDRDVVREDLELVGLVLRVEDFEARNGDNADSEAVLLLEGGGGINTDVDLRAGGDEGEGGVGSLQHGVSTLQGTLNSGALKLRQVLTGKGQNAGGVLGGQRRVVSSAGFVAISRAPDHAVGQGTEVGQSLNRLVSRTVLTQTDGVVGSDVDDTDVRQGRETNGTGSIGNEVQEGTAGRDDSAVGSETVHDSGHSVLTHTVADVAARTVTNAVLRGLEVDGVLPAGVVGASQVSRAGQEFGDDTVNLLEDSLGQLARGDSRVAGLVGWQALLPSLRELASKTASQVGVFSLVLRGILLEELVPLLLLGSAISSLLVVHVVDLLRDNEGLFGVEAKDLLDVLAVILLERATVDTTSALLLGTETDGGLQLDHGRLVSDLTSLDDGILNALPVVITVLDFESVPAVGLEALRDILGEGALGVTV